MLMQMYDAVILGGGIAGLYLAYHMAKSKKRVLLIEQNKSRLGGRIYTHKDSTMTVEAGAGRIHRGHRLFLELVRELGLENKLVEIDNDSTFMESGVGFWKKNPHRTVLARVIREAKSRTKQELIAKTLMEFANAICDPKDVQLAMDSFGYTTEFTYMNAYDAVELMKIIALHQQYYVMSGGLSQVVDALVERIGCEIQMGSTVTSIRKCADATFIIHCEVNNITHSYEAKKCICTFPAKDVASVRFLGEAEFRDKTGIWKRLIKSSIYSGSLCRIYSHIGRGDWFNDTGKITINDDLRMIIPIEGNLAMISYSDNVIANRWHKTYSEGGISAINKKLKYLIQRDVGMNPGNLKNTRVFYWENAVGYWRVGADSRSVEHIATNNVAGLYFCGENYSSKNQQWIEGALDTAKMVLRDCVFETGH